jgi:hypothetical protein
MRWVGSRAPTLSAKDAEKGGAPIEKIRLTARLKASPDTNWAFSTKSEQRSGISAAY